jgi:hypothetical protein
MSRVRIVFQNGALLVNGRFFFLLFLSFQSAKYELSLHRALLERRLRLMCVL